MRNQTTPKSFRALSFLIATVIIATVLLNACQYPAHDSENGEICFSDDLGRTVSLKKAPTRIAALIGSFADVWQLAGGSVVASADDAWDEFGLEMGEALHLGGAHSPNLEQLLSCSPDLVLASASTASNLQMRDILEAADIPVAYFDVDHFEDYLRMLNICTDLTGRKDLYEKNGLALQKQIEAIKATYASSEIPEKERTVLLLRASGSSVKAKGSEGTVLGEMLKDMGCINIADSDSSLLENLNVESVIRQEPYHIFAVTMGNDTEAAKASLESMIKENPAWESLEAVRENRLHLMDKKLFNLKPNARWGEAYEKLFETLTKK